jgi:hypothetical protein
MSPPPPGDAPQREYEVAEASFDITEQAAAQPGAVIEGQADEDGKRRNDAALASTYDPALAKSGKTDEEIDKQKHDEALAIGGAAIVAAVVIAHELDAQHHHDADLPQHDSLDAQHNDHSEDG